MTEIICFLGGVLVGALVPKATALAKLAWGKFTDWLNRKTPQ